jgi:hypothetical protein
MWGGHDAIKSLKTLCVYVEVNKERKSSKE